MLKLFRKKSIKNLGQHNCYLTIDELPIRIWFDIHKEGDYTKLIKTSIKLTDNNLLEISNIWSKMYNEYINKFGLSDEFMSDLRDEIKLANLQADYIITGQAYFKTLINIEKEKKRIFDLEIREPQDLEVVLAKMSKYYGFKLNSRELTTTEYYSYLENVTDGKN